MRTRLRVFASLALALAALAPAMHVALADDDAVPPRVVILRKLPTDATALINVTRAEMPGSPDILNLGKRATGALVRCLSDNTDAGLRVECAEILNDLGDRSALPALRTALEDWEEPVRYAVVRALGTMPDKASFAPLAKVAERKDESDQVKDAAIAALGALGSQDAVRFLRTALHRVPKKDEPDRRAAIFYALWQSRSLMARTTFVADTVYALKSGADSLIYAGVEASTELRERALSAALIPLMDHANAEVRNKAVYALGHIGDPTATRALMAHLPKVRESRMLNNIAFALERLDRKAFYVAIDKLAQHKQAVIRLNAAFVIGDVRRPEGLPILARTAGDASDLVKASSVAAIGKLDTPDAVPVAEKYIGDANWSIREQAVYAVTALTHGKRKDLVYDKLFAAKLPRRGGDEIRRRAAVKLGELGDTRVRDYLVKCYETRACGYGDVADFFSADHDATASQRLLLDWVQGRTELTDLLGHKNPSGAGLLAASSLGQARALDNRYRLRSSADFLGYVGSAATRPALAPDLRASSLWTRLHVAVAAARLGDAQAAASLVTELDNAPAAWAPHIVRLLTRIEEPKLRASLKPELERRSKGADVDVAMASAAVLLDWDADAGFFRFLDALASSSPREQALAREYLLRARDKKVTWVMRRALARETRPFVRDDLRVLLDDRS